MTDVSIVMGSDSDLGIMSQAAEILEKLGVSYEITVLRLTERRSLCRICCGR